jgi:hypothetical protein
MVIQYRRKESRAGGRDPMYNPERDIAHIGPPMLHQACEALDEQWWEPWFQEYCIANDITETQIAEGAPLLAQACNKIIEAENPVEALEEVGFTALHPSIQLAFYAKIGQCFLANLWAGVKDVSSPEDEPPAPIRMLLGMSDTIMRQFANMDKEAEEPRLRGGQTLREDDE